MARHLPLLAVLLVAFVMTIPASSSLIPGGTTEERPFNPEVQDLLSNLRDEVESELGRRVAKFDLVSYKTQVVQGINYFAKIDIGNDEYVHIRAYQNLQQNLSLEGVQHPKTRDEEIVYF